MAHRSGEGGDRGDKLPDSKQGASRPGRSESADHPDVTARGQPSSGAGREGSEAGERNEGRQGHGGRRSGEASDRPDVSGSRRPGPEVLGDKEWEKFQRSRWVSPSDGVGHRFGEKEAAPGEVDRFLKDLPEGKRNALNDPDAKVYLHSSASRPGAEANNQKLTEQRGAEVKKELEARGVKAQITVVPLGEREARQDDRSPMSAKEPSDRDPEDRVDDPWDRTTRVDIRPAAEKTGVDPKRLEGEDIKRTVNRGEDVFKEVLDPLGEKVRDQAPLPKNPILPDPARDPKEFLGQLADIIPDALKDAANPAKAVGKKVPAFVFEEARDQWRKEVEEKRDPLFRAIAEGAASGLDPGYKSAWKPENAEQKALYDEARRSVQGLSEQERLQLGAYLTNYATQFETTVNYLAPRMEGSHFRSGVERIFSSDKHFDYN
jgi:outer membrane protein OmpA-like peptidoglycan-associated protein